MYNPEIIRDVTIKARIITAAHTIIKTRKYLSIALTAFRSDEGDIPPLFALTCAGIRNIEIYPAAAVIRGIQRYVFTVFLCRNRSAIMTAAAMNIATKDAISE